MFTCLKKFYFNLAIFGGRKPRAQLDAKLRIRSDIIRYKNSVFEKIFEGFQSLVSKPVTVHS